jgi:hypothetical protein
MASKANCDDDTLRSTVLEALFYFYESNPKNQAPETLLTSLSNRTLKPWFKSHPQTLVPEAHSKSTYPSVFIFFTSAPIQAPARSTCATAPPPPVPILIVGSVLLVGQKSLLNIPVVIVKHTDSIPKERKKKNSNLSPFIYGFLPNSLVLAGLFIRESSYVVNYQYSEE